MQFTLGKVHIGTSGFSYKHWRGLFYPDGIKPKDYLSYYATHFSATEINASFYRLPQEHTVESWAAQVPESFRFCPKMSRYLTHMKKLRDPEEPLARFFSVFVPLHHMLGPVLVQLPAQLAFRKEVALHFYAALREEHTGLDFVLEIRHPSWLADESLRLMESYGIGVVIAESGGHFPYAEIITAKIIYLRFHGPRELYASAYSDEDLAAFAAKMKNWTALGLEVWAFFNNDIHGYAPVDAARLRTMIMEE